MACRKQTRGESIPMQQMWPHQLKFECFKGPWKEQTWRSEIQVSKVWLWSHTERKPAHSQAGGSWRDCSCLQSLQLQSQHKKKSEFTQKVKTLRIVWGPICLKPPESQIYSIYNVFSSLPVATQYRIDPIYSLYNVFSDIFKSTCCTSIWYWANIFHIFSSLPVASQYRIGLMVNEPPVTTSPPKLSSCLQRKVRRMMRVWQIWIRINIRI